MKRGNGFNLQYNQMNNHFRRIGATPNINARINTSKELLPYDNLLIVKTSTKLPYCNSSILLSLEVPILVPLSGVTPTW